MYSFPPYFYHPQIPMGIPPVFPPIAGMYGFFYPWRAHSCCCAPFFPNTAPTLNTMPPEQYVKQWESPESPQESWIQAYEQEFGKEKKER